MASEAYQTEHVHQVNEDGDEYEIDQQRLPDPAINVSQQTF